MILKTEALNLILENHTIMKRVILFIAFILSFSAVAQVEQLGGPISWKAKTNSSNLKPIALPSFDLEKYIKEDAINDVTKETPWRFGHKHQVNYSLKNSGKWTAVHNGRIWRIRFQSKDALTMNFILKNLHIPNGGHIHIYNTQKTSFIGAYTSVNNTPSKTLGTDLVSGDDVTLELFEPTGEAGNSSLTITEVVHGYRSISLHEDEVMKELNDSGNCNRDVRCLSDNEPLWVNESNSVALIVVNGNGSCTGTLLNNTAEDGTPYFLTANHCLGDPATWAFRFKWISPDPQCETTTNSTNTANDTEYQTMNGSVLRASNAGSDVALVEITNLDLTTAASWGLFYAGWDRTGDAVPAAIGIHHPRGDIMKYAREEQALVKEVWNGADCWRVTSWDEGVTEPGSSGSALFDYNHRVIGQLFGGGAACDGTTDNNQPDWYGRLDISWDGSASNNRLKDWLDPSNSEPFVLDGFDPNQPSVAIDARIQSISSPSGSYCQTDEFIPEVILRNAGTSDLTSVTIEYGISGGTLLTFDWTGSLTTNQTELITLPAMTAPDGQNVFEARTIEPNTVADENPTNDEATSNFTIILNGLIIDFNLELDCWGTETSWELTDNQNTVTHSGGTYTNAIPEGAGTITEEWCLLEEECYTFTINDSYGDGMNGTQWNCDVDGYYSISFDGTILTELIAENADFVNQEVNPFCVPSSIQPNFNSSEQNICLGEDVIFTDASENVTTWDWDFGIDADPATTSGIGPHTVSYSSPGTKTITLTVDEGHTQTMEITVNDLPDTPSITADGPTEFCDGDAVTLTSSIAPSYSWSNGATSQAITVNSSDSYTVTITDNNGCSATSVSEDITVVANPIISVLSVDEPTSCGTSTGSIEIQGSETGDLVWLGTINGNANGVALPYTITDLSAGSYSISLTNSSGCISNSLSQSISDPNAPDKPIITADGPTTFCDGESVVLTSSDETGNTWSNNETTQSITVTKSGYFYVTITDGLGCSATSDGITITVNELPNNPTITTDGSTSFCDGESVVLTSSFETSNTWSNGETSQSITVTNSDSYTVTFTDENGCSATSDEISTSVNDLPIVTLGIFDNYCNTSDSIALNTGDPIGGTYSGNGVEGTVFNPSEVGEGSHLITYTFTDANGCTNSDSETVVVDDCINLDELQETVFNVYPNPASNVLYVVGLHENVTTILVHDAMGRVVIQKNNVVNSDQIELNVSPLSNGVYTISIYNGNKIQHERVVINK